MAVIDYYQVLGLSDKECLSTEVTQKYQELKKRYEKGCVTEDDRRHYATILEAYMVLGSPKMRESYDEVYARENSLDGSKAEAGDDEELSRYINRARMKAKEHARKLKSPAQRKRANKIKFIIGAVLIVVIGVLIMLSRMAIEPSYHRADNCFLNFTNLKGDILKIEMITSATVPLTEMTFDNYDCHSGVDLLGSNVVIDFDDQGNIKRYCGYTTKGAMLFEVTDFNNGGGQRRGQFPAMLGYMTKSITSVKYVSKGKNVIAVDYYEGNQKEFGQQVKYDGHGNPVVVSKENYEWERMEHSLGIEIPFGYKDSTVYKYLEYDSHGNWTLAEAQYHGLTKNHDFSYYIKRQITYNGDFKKSALIDQLDDFVAAHNAAAAMPAMRRVNAKYLDLDLPATLIAAPQQEVAAIEHSWQQAGLTNGEHLILGDYQTKEGEPYANVLINTATIDDEGADDSSLDDVLNAPFDAMLNDELRDNFLANEDVIGMKLVHWEPYEILKVGGKTALKQSYYFLVKGNPIPAHACQYSIPIGDGKKIDIALVSTSTATITWDKIFEKVLSSVSWNEIAP